MQKEKLFTKNYIFACIGNLLECFGFFALLPILPMFLIEKCGVSQLHTGIVLASYTFSAMIARPVSAYFSDLYNRKKLFCALFFVYSVLFLPYPFFQSVAFFILIRMTHGFVFGGLSVCGNAFIIDIIHEKRRGEGIGFFGITNSMGLALGPMGGFYIYEMTGNFLWVFISAFLFSIIGFIFISQIRLSAQKQKIVRNAETKKITFDKFYQIKGFYAGIALLLLSSPYGLIVSFSAFYAKELGIVGGLGLFFAFLSTGLMLSRMFSGKMVDKGKITGVIIFGAFMVSVVLASFSSLKFLNIENLIITRILFYAAGLFLGFGYGIMFPAFNMLFVNLSPDNRRAAASSTYLTNWDIGLGLGLILGGIVMGKFGMAVSYLIGAIIAFISAVYFSLFVAPHFQKNRLR
jgi:MFS family permease